ncbi:MAG: FAD-binding oxidoreductase [Gemmatimonadaceae bacterium]
MTRPPPGIGPPSGFRGTFRTDPAARGVYSEAAGIGRALPLAVAVPQDADDVALIVKWARDSGLAVIPRGSGSSMAGGAIGAGVVMDLSRLRELGEPGEDGRSIRAGAGILRGELHRRAMAAGLRFPVDPSSGEFCTIAGMAATNAAGPHTLRHGSMRPWVLALDCVFEDGSRATIRRGEKPPASVEPVARFLRDAHGRLLDGRRSAASHAAVMKDSSGYAISTYAQTMELVDLLVGSEGTLALFTAVEVALIPLASSTASVFVSFRELEAAVEAAVEAREHGASACELLDRTFLRIAAGAGKPLPVAQDAEAALLIEVESDAPTGEAGAKATADRLQARLQRLGAANSIVSVGPAHEAELWSFRHAASPAIARMDPALRSMQFIEDAAVPPAALAEYVRGIRAILERNDTAGVIFGHAGDAHVHVNPLLDVARTDWRERVERILLEGTDLVSRLGGTTSGEHGDGRLRTPLMERVWSREELARFALVKKAFDPGNVLNPGVKVPAPGQKAIDIVKYDPNLEALAPEARQALETVERERAYARFRLDML